MSSLALQIPLPEKFKNNQGLSDETKQEYRKILALYSSDTLDAAEWHISLTIANRTGNICFPKTTKTIESDITKITAIIMLTSGASIATCQRRVHDFDTIFNFFHSENIELPCLTQEGVNNFIQYLDGSSFDNWKRNQYMSKYPEFSRTDKGDYKSTEEMAARIEVLEDRLSKSVNRNKELLAEIQKIRAESAIKYKQLQLDYERLAGAYQKETEKKIIRL